MHGSTSANARRSDYYSGLEVSSQSVVSFTGCENGLFECIFLIARSLKIQIVPSRCNKLHTSALFPLIRPSGVPASCLSTLHLPANWGFGVSKCTVLDDTELKIVVPVVQGGMQWVGYAELASAVSNAGGLGIVRCEAQILPTNDHSP